MESITSGNLETKKDWKKDSRVGWFIGHFIEDENSLKMNDFEVKWSHHLKGEKTC